MSSDDQMLPQWWVDATAHSLEGHDRGGAVRAVAEVLFATHDGPPPPERLAWLVSEVERLRGQVRGRGMLVFRLALFAATWLAPLWSMRVPTLGRLPLELRARVLDRWERSPFGMSLFAIKAILCILWFEHPDAARAIGFDGRPLVEGPEAVRG